MQYPAFDRARRNLLFISVFSIAYRAMKLNLKTIPFPGNVTADYDHSLLSAGIFLFLLYFAFRFTAAFYDIRGWQELKTIFVNEFIDYFKNGVAKKAAWVAATANVRDLHHVNVEYISDFQYEKLPSLFADIKIRARVVTYTKSFTANNMDVAIQLSKQHIRKGYAYATYRTLFSRSAFSEYLFPFILACIAVCEMFHLSIVIPLADLLVPRYNA